MIIIKDICKRYDDVIVFENYSILLEKNKINCIMGQSGSGKTTLVRLLMGLEHADKGSIQGIEGLKKSAVFQEDRLCENLDVLTNIVMPHINKESFNKFSRLQIETALDCVDLSGCSDKKVSTLSGGMKRRVAILRAILADYDLLILDEPFKELDENTKKLNINYLLEKAKGKTVIFITHDKYELELIKPDILVRL